MKHNKHQQQKRITKKIKYNKCKQVRTTAWNCLGGVFVYNTVTMQDRATYYSLVGILNCVFDLTWA